ncbi:lipopolysaccharide transport periplasmic protein LptA [Gallaecimonas pentaromativorans]|uniref:Lipopolysaccharide export system protein LptA n=1 Tax=Gallaecimonas pentaromativorans TaxID=584787 RepID=A0A3N1Q1T6_9GAMM|nr:lipopolysaccharide transport periplasmic protein LptA [Gallaecimonas pentaromativorans]MED5523616.1 lipopolysaccharide transport periplasmic protein LptA [Pseudomonadota bacterium]ROQ30806.1 lipopolysaccharide export system protein LptA [Gallaecimonas pentaromativorans]
MNSSKIISSVLLALLLPLQAMASDGDFGEKIAISSSKNYADGLKKIIVYEHDVKITQGSLTITADRLEVNASGPERIFTATGNPVTFRQKLNDGTWVKAQAKEIRYYDNKRLVVMTGAAQIEQNGSLAKGDTIKYDLANQRLMATADDEQGRVTTIFEPSKNAATNNEPDAIPAIPTEPEQQEDPSEHNNAQEGH